MGVDQMPVARTGEVFTSTSAVLSSTTANAIGRFLHARFAFIGTTCFRQRELFHTKSRKSTKSRRTGRMGLPRRPRTTPHPTATLLLDTTVGLLETVPVDELTIAMVLERSGPLHHH